MQIKLIASLVGAFGFGALVGWAITTDIHEKRLFLEREGYDELLADKTDHIFYLKEKNNRLQSHATQQESVDIFFDPAKDILNTIMAEPTELTSADFVVEAVALDGETSEDVDEEIVIPDDVIPENETPEETRSNLQALIDAYTADPEAQAEFVDIATNAQEYDKAPPFVISRADYAYDEEGEHYEKITLTYYMRDRVLLDDDEDPIDDVPRTVGWRNLSQFGGESGDPNVVFVRNRHMMTDFEVVKEDDQTLPLHVKYGMPREEFRVNKAAGLIKLRREDE